MKTLTPVMLVVGALCCMLAAPAHAETIQIQLTGFDFTYDGSNIRDAGAAEIGNADPTQADDLATVELFVDEVLVGKLTSGPDLGLFADLLIEGVAGLPAAGGTIITTGNGDSLGVELFTSTGGDSPVTSTLLALSVDQFAVNYTVFADPISIELTMAAGPASGLLEQALPFDLALDPSDEISILISSVDLSNVTADGSYVTGFDAFGTGEIAGSVIPEPGSVVLLACGALALLIPVIRRRRA